MRVTNPVSLSFSKKRIDLIVLLLLCIYPLVGMGIDLIAPSLPAISQELGISSAISKNLIAVYLLGLAIGNFIIGFLSDALGRRIFFLGGTLVFTLASLLPTFFAQPDILLGSRFLQGIAIGAFTVVSRAIIADILSVERLIRTATLTATMWGIGPIIGPIIGGYLQYYFDWQASFYFFAAYGLLGFITAVFVIPETHFKRQKLDLRQIQNNLKTILTHRLFIGMVTLMGLSYSLLIVFNTLGPFLIQSVFKHSPVFFGHVAFCMGLAFLAGTILCRRLIKEFTLEDVLLFSLALVFVIALIGLLFVYLAKVNIYIIIILSLLIFLGCGVIYPASTGKGLSLFRHLAGSGAAVMNLINVTTTSLVAFLMGFINISSAVPIAWMYLVLMLLSCCSYWFFVYKAKKD